MKRPSTGVLGVVISVGLHAAGLGALYLHSGSTASPFEKPPAVKIRIVKRSEKKPEVAPASIAKVEKTISPPVVQPPQKPERKIQPRSVIPTKPLVQETKAEKDPASPSKPPRFVVSMEATVASGLVSVPVSGDTQSGQNRDPRSDKNVAEKRVTIEVGELTKLPRLLQSPSEDIMRSAYPSEARQNGIEGDVGLMLLVRQDGRVEKVRLKRKAGYGFDELARGFAKTFVFSPAEKDGLPVAVWIPWTYKFRLGDS